MNTLTLLRYGIYMPCVAITFNDFFIGVKKVQGDTYVRGVSDGNGALIRNQETWILINRYKSEELRRGNPAGKGDLVVMTDPFNPNRSIIRRLRGVGEEWVRDSDEDGSWFHVYLRKGFCYVDSLFRSPPSPMVSKYSNNAAIDTHSAIGTGHNVKNSEECKQNKEANLHVNEAAEHVAVENEDRRYDSLQFGPVSLGLLLGSPIMILYPIDRMAFLSSPLVPAVNPPIPP